MKLIRTLLLIAVALVITRAYSRAEGASKTAAWIDGITVAPVAAQRSAEFTGASDLGGGLDIGFGVNKYVSIHVANLTFENDDWRSAAVDETEVYVKANLARFHKESFLIYAKGGAVRDWNDDKWAIGVGAGAQLNLTGNIALISDYTIRAKFGADESGIARAGIQFGF